jgi:hypothetical protein
MGKLTQEEWLQLVDLLLECPAMQDRDGRDDVLAFLQDATRNAIKRRAETRADVINIVRTCNNYPGQIEALIDGVRCYNMGMSQLSRLEEFWQGLCHPGVQAAPVEVDKNRIYLMIQEALNHADFRKAIKTFQDVLSRFDKHGGTALFFLQKGYTMGAHMLVQRMTDILITGGCHHHTVPIKLVPGLTQGTHGILQHFANHYNLSIRATSPIPDHIELVVRTICNSLQNGSVLLIQVSGWDYFPDHSSTLSWFVEHFWSYLVSEILTTLKQRDLRKVRVIAVLIADIEVSSDMVDASLWCEGEEFASEKLLPLPLENWTCEDIQECIATVPHLSGHQIDTMAHAIYQASGCGQPRDVAELLLKQFYA